MKTLNDVKEKLDKYGISYENSTDYGWEEGLILEGNDCDILLYHVKDRIICYDLFMKGKSYPMFEIVKQKDNTTSYRNDYDNVELMLEDLEIEYSL